MDPRQFAQEWVDAWNVRDIEAIISHYSDDIEFISPRVAAAGGGAGDSSGRLVGKAALRAYFQEALDKLKVLSLTIQVRAARLPSPSACAGAPSSCWPGGWTCRCCSLFRLQAAGYVHASSPWGFCGSCRCLQLQACK